MQKKQQKSRQKSAKTKSEVRKRVERKEKKSKLERRGKKGGSEGTAGLEWVVSSQQRVGCGRWDGLNTALAVASPSTARLARGPVSSLFATQNPIVRFVVLARVQL